MTGKRWAVSTDGKLYYLAPETAETVPPGIYTIGVIPNIGPALSVVTPKTENVMRFPGGVVDRVVAEVEDFWGTGERFAAHGLPHKRGYLLHGPPGSGKSSALRLIASDVAERGGVVMVYTAASAFGPVYKAFRSVQPETPVVVMMEDLDSIITPSNESLVLNTLDGVEDVQRIVFVASTNYPEKLSERIANRPSRFDRRIQVGHPPAEHRAAYLESLLLPGEDGIDVQRWAADTEGLSFAHVKELFVAVAVLGADYGDTIKLLKTMAAPASSVSDAGGAPAGQYL